MVTCNSLNYTCKGTQLRVWGPLLHTLSLSLPRTLSLPQTSRANPVQCYSTHQEKYASPYSASKFACRVIVVLSLLVILSNQPYILPPKSPTLTKRALRSLKRALYITVGMLQRDRKVEWPVGSRPLRVYIIWKESCIITQKSPKIAKRALYKRALHYHAKEP